MKRTVALGLGLLLVIGLVAGCGGGKESKNASSPSQQVAQPSSTQPSASEPAARPEPTLKAEGTVVVYSSVSQSILDKMTAALKTKYPSLDVQFVYGGTEELVDKLNAEFAAGTVKADAIMMADPAYARLLKSQGVLSPYVPKGAEAVKVDRDKEGYYTAVRVIDVVIIYNPDLVTKDQAPKSFKDLLDPKWAGQVALSDPTKSGTSFATVGALAGTYGWEYFQTAQANKWQVGGGSSNPAKLVSEGKAKVGVSVESTFRSTKDKGAKIDMVWPEDGAIVMESPYAILKSTKNSDGAKIVADWLITQEAQTLFVQGNMHPVISGLPAPTGSIPLDQLLSRAMKVNWADLADNKGQIQDKFLQIVTISK